MLESEDALARVAAVETAIGNLSERLARLESRVDALAEQAAVDQKQLKRVVEMKTARAGEMSSRIAQRIAKIESAVELLARADARETSEEMSD